MSEKKPETGVRRAATKKTAGVRGKKTARKSPVRKAVPASNAFAGFLLAGSLVALAILGLTVVRQQRAINELQHAIRTEDAAVSKGDGDSAARKETAPTKQQSEQKPEVKEPGTVAGVLCMLHYDEQKDQVSYVKVRRTLDEPTIAAAMLELIKGPDAKERAKGILSTIPHDLKVRSIVIKGDTATIDLSSDFLHEAFGDIAVNRINQVFTTATQFESVSSVIILVEGRELHDIDGRVIDWPLKRRL